MDLGSKIKELRVNKNITQQEFANMLCVSNKTISSWECNRTIPEINMLFKIASFLNVSLYALLDNYTNIEPFEIEVKLKVDCKEFNRILSTLNQKGMQTAEVNQIDSYYIPTYKHFDNEWLRLRNEDGKNIITYKKKIEDKCCEELESIFDNGEIFEKILFNLDFKKKGVITKKRIKILYDNKYEFSFDTVENIGLFIEIEVKKIETDRLEEIQKLMSLLNELKRDLKQIDEKRYFDYL